MTVKNIWGSETDGRQYSEVRGTSMGITEPPKDFRWYHSEMGASHGQDVVHSEYRKDTIATYREIRLEWLDQFDLEITEEGAFRWWRWYNKERTCRWSERRPIDAPMPINPGLWPNDGGE